ncbi:MAG: hypothetical protein FWE27_06775 [Defluviitaleaceae bacterium]|nr:hypothetical protein [Defluviitaleaceae bacterium]
MKRITIKNRLFAFVVAVSMLAGIFTAMPIAVSASGCTISMNVTTAAETITPGTQNVTLDVSMAGNPGFGMFQYKIEHDSDYVQSLTRSNVDFPSTVLEWHIPPAAEQAANKWRETQFMTDAEGGFIGNGVMSRYTFTIAANAPVGHVINFTLTKEGSLEPDFPFGALDVTVATPTIAVTVVDLPPEPAENVTIEVSHSDARFGIDELVLTVSHDGNGTDKFYFVIAYSQGTNQPTRMVVEADVTSEQTAIPTGLFTAAGAQISVWAMESPPFDTESLFNNNKGIYPAN